MLKKKIFLLFACSTIITFVYSQVKQASRKKNPQTRSSVAATKKLVPEPVKGDNSVLFEISGRGLTQPSWLFGTMHILCEKDAKLSDGLKNVIKKSRQLYFEVDMDDMPQMMNALQFVRMNNNVKISDLLTPVEYDRVKLYFDQHKSMMPFAMMNRFKPFFVSAVIAEGLLGCEKKSSMEQLIMTESKKYEKNISGLETLEFQASLFDSIPYEEQAKDLLKYVDSIDTYRVMMNQVVTLYKKQDIAAVDSMMQISDPGMNQYLGIMLYDRNKRWTGQIEEQVFQMPTLFAVGAGHLGGEKGLVNLLRKEGFTVKALKN